MTKVAIIGGGNIGTLMAGEFAARGHEVRMCTSDAHEWSKTIEVLGNDGERLCVGRISLVTSSLVDAIRGASWVFVTHPSSRFKVLAQELVPLVESGQKVVVVPGADAEFWFADLIRNGAELLGLQRVHSIARLKERGRSVYRLGLKKSIQVGSVPSTCASIVVPELSGLFAMPVEIVPNYLVETLTPSNPILHTTRLATMFRDWRHGVTYQANIPFYETWDDDSSTLLIACDVELQELCRKIEGEIGIDLSGVKPLTEHYESPDARSMTEKISSIPAFRGLLSPMREVVSGKWVPDFNSRYFTSDFNIGLRVIVELADVFEFPVPTLRSVISWYEAIDGSRSHTKIVKMNRVDMCRLYK